MKLEITPATSSGGASGGTPAVVLGSAVSSGVSTTFLRDDDTIKAFDETTPANISSSGSTGTNAFSARSDHTHTIGTGIVTRTMLDATAKNWQFLGQGTASAAVRTGTITWTGTFAELWFEYFIAGYSGNAVGRVIVGPTAGLSETGTTFCNSQLEGTTLTTTVISIPGWPLATTVSAVPRYGHIWVKNIANQVKLMTGHGQWGGTAPTAVPTQMRFEGMFNDSTNLINKAELAVYNNLTATTVSTTTFNTGTFLNVWGRNAD